MAWQEWSADYLFFWRDHALRAHLLTRRSNQYFCAGPAAGVGDLLAENPAAN
jgi:hypothetical protein